MKHRKHIRLRGFDYSAGYYYFVTVCTRNRIEYFAPRVSDKYRSLLQKSVVAARPWRDNQKENTEIVEEKLLLLEEKFNAVIDFYCFMPDHIHFIIGLQARQGRAATTEKTNLSWVINAFKGWCTRQFEKPIFQPNFYEHIIRDEASHDRIRNYILHNPYLAYEDIPWKRIDPEIK